MSDDPDCLGMCAMDGDVCSGCGRSLDPITAARAGDDLPPSPEGEDGPDLRLRKPAANG